MSIKKLFLICAFLSISILPFLINVPEAKALTVEELLTQITNLQAQIAQLQQQLAELQKVPTAWCHDFNLNLRIGDSGAEVTALQTALQKEGFYQRTITGNFDEYTASAVVGFQEKYKEDILTPWGLERGTGYVGKTTRTKLNELYGCKIKPSITVLSPNGGEVWVKGSVQTIKWSGATSNYVIVDLVRGPNNAYVKSISVGTAATTGQFTWQVSLDIPDGNDYKAYINEMDELGAYSTKSDFSDLPFSIVIKPGVACADSDASLGYPAYLKTKGTCTDSTGTYTDSKATTLTDGVREYYCGPTANTPENQKCLWTEYSCPGNLGTSYTYGDGNCKGAETIQTKIGETFTISLNSNPSTGYDWQIDKIDNNYLKLISRECPNTSGLPAGAPCTLTLKFQALKVGETELHLTYCRSWECAATTTDTKSYKIIISPASTCTDSDGGKDYYMKGTVTAGGVNYTDSCTYCTGFCVNPPCEVTCGAVKEYYCEGNEVKSETYVCPSGYTCKDGACTKVEKSITVISPNGGEQWQIGKTYDITWKATGIDKVNIYLDEVELEGGIGSEIACSQASYCAFQYCEPCNFEKKIASNISASLGKYSWTIPTTQVPVVKAKIFIEAVGVFPKVNDGSDSYFSIVKGTETIQTKTGETFTISLNSNPSTGYDWQIDKIDNNYLEYIKKDFVQNLPAMPGQGGTSTLYFKALKAGQTELRLVYCRSWECQKTIAETRNYTVIIVSDLVLKNIENQLASIANAASKIMEMIKGLMGR
jgi:inhibitor of cysteine peptidase